MNRILNITNGDCAAALMHEADIAGEILPWRDALHFGPVPEGKALEDLSKQRAQFLAEFFAVGECNTLKSFRDRDTKLTSLCADTKIVLWFEHDLYDQLQLLQVLDWFHHSDHPASLLSLICTENYLGTLKPADLLSLYQCETPVSHRQLELASHAWRAFRSDTPEDWYALLEQDTHALPFLAGTVRRILEEYPSLTNGLSRTEQQVLSIVSEGETDPRRIFSRNQELEQRVFMGDSGFWKILQQFVDATPPLLSPIKDSSQDEIAIPDVEVHLTPYGEATLAGKENWLATNPAKRWIGGVFLNSESVWCRDASGRCIESIIPHPQ